MTNAPIRSRLLYSLLGITLLIWLGMGATLYIDMHHEVDELFDAELAERAHTLFDLHLQSDSSQEVRASQNLRFPAHNNSHHKLDKFVYQVWDNRQDRLINRSSNAPKEHLSATRNGFSSEQIDGMLWRIYSVSDTTDQFMIQVGEHSYFRDELNSDFAIRLATPMLFVLPLFGVFISIAIGHGLRPLTQLTDELVDRDPHHLSPVNTARAPAEILPVVKALNRLFARVSLTLEHERRFTADASHEIRTPLAALKTQAQVALRSKQDDERNSALRQVVEGVDRATHLTEQLLTLARIDPDNCCLQPRPVQLVDIASEVIANLYPMAQARQIEPEIDVPDEERGNMLGFPEILSILIRNLLDNALRYSPEGGQVQLLIRADEESVELEVADSGPGIPKEMRSRIFDRFFRLEGSKTQGSGLGLSIVNRIAELHQTKVELGQSHLGGLAVRLRFPRAMEIRDEQ